MDSSHKIRKYIAIDLKSFYASVECVEAGLDPLAARLVVADESRTDKTICLAVSPALKAFGVPGRPRLFEVKTIVNEINAHRDKDDALDFIIAPPRMAKYIEYSTKIYGIYLKYVSPDDIFAYSVDEVFMDVTDYLDYYKKDAHELAMTMIRDVLAETGITATAGIGTNLYLAKVAMDIVAKHIPADKDGVRIAELDERSFREKLWAHTPITDFWRTGPGIAKRLYAHGMYTMGDIARCSLGSDKDYYNQELLFKIFGVNAELIIDHAWGYEPCDIGHVKAYVPTNNSMGEGQVLPEPYTNEKGRLICREMSELLALKLVKKGLVADQVVLTIGYDAVNALDPKILNKYAGEMKVDHYGRKVPKHAHGSRNLSGYTSLTSEIVDAMLSIFDEETDPDLFIRRVNVCANHVIPRDAANEMDKEEKFEQLDLFTDYEKRNKEEEALKEKRRKEEALQEATLKIQERYGKNAMLKGMNLLEGGRTMERNAQIGGHKA